MQKTITVIALWTILSSGIVPGASRWKEVSVPQPAAQFAFVDFADSLDGMLFSKSGVYAGTIDGGKTWTLDSVSLAGQVTDMKYFGKKHCWIQTDSASYPALYYTSDSKAWMQRRLPDTLRYTRPSCGFATEEKIFINSGKAMLASYNGGVTWQKKFPAFGAIHSISFADSTTGIATFSNIGASGETMACLSLRTQDGGTTWDTLKAGDTAYDDVHFYTPQRGFMTWNYSSMEAMWFRTGAAFTTDGGKSFHDILTAATGGSDRFFPVGGIEFDASSRFMLASDSRIKKDAEGMFTVVRGDTAGILITAFESVSENYNWILAAGSRIFQSIGIPTGMASGHTSPSISDMRLEQNYPNPFNPSTTIAFSLPFKARISLKIFDLLGREVAILASSEELSAGTYARQWDASGVPSGMYFYRLQAAGFTETKRLLLVK